MFSKYMFARYVKLWIMPIRNLTAVPNKCNNLRVRQITFELLQLSYHEKNNLVNNPDYVLHKKQLLDELDRLLKN